MPSGRFQAICLTSNSFRLDRALHHVFITGASISTVGRRLHSSTSTSASASSSQWADTSHSSNNAHTEILREKAEAIQVLKNALTEIRLKNRGIDSGVLRKIQSPKIQTQAQAQTQTRTRTQTPKKSTKITKPAFPTHLQDKKRGFGSKGNSDSAFKTPIKRLYLGENVFSIFRGVPPNCRLEPHDSTLNYTGHEILPDLDDPFCSSPWLEETNLTGLELLNHEIKAFAKYILPSNEEYAARRAVIEKVEKIVAELSSNQFHVATFGSVAVGYDLSHADVDMRLYRHGDENRTRSPKEKAKKQLIRFLPKLQQALRVNGFSRIYIQNSRYPLVDALHSDSGVAVQVVCANNNRTSQEYIEKAMKEYPDLINVYATLRTMLRVRRLNDVFHGGLGSYSLMNMLIASYKLVPGKSSAENLANFLEFYSNLDTTAYTVGLIPRAALHPKQLSINSSNRPGVILNDDDNQQDWIQAKHKLGSRNAQLRFLLVLQDPNDKHNDLGRKAFAWNHIKETFKCALDDIKQGIVKPEILKQQEGSILLPLVGVSEKYFAFQRTRTREWGEKVTRGGFQFKYTDFEKVREFEDADNAVDTWEYFEKLNESESPWTKAQKWFQKLTQFKSTNVDEEFRRLESADNVVDEWNRFDNLIASRPQRTKARK